VQTQTGDGIQIDESVIDDSNLASGDDNQQAIDQSTNVDVDVPAPEAPPEPNGGEEGGGEEALL
jgi:hypothetical protein